MRLVVSLLTHNSERYAERCLQSVVGQEGLGILGKDWQIVCLDNASKNRIELARLEKKFPEVKFLKEERNHGFGKGHNIVMRKFPATFHTVLNIDLLLSSSFLSLLIQALEQNPKFGSAIGKLFRWDFGGNPEKTSIIDSVGIGVTKDHAFFDIGQGERDKGQFEKVADRFGGSAAAIVYRRSSLEEIAYSKGSEPEAEFFDETMFMYKEDIDLSYRLLVNGHPCLYVPEAVAWHARGTGGGKRRRKRSQEERVWSTAHEVLLLQKHKQWWGESIQRATAIRQFCRSLYLLLLEPKVFFASRKLLRTLEPEARKRRNAVKHRISFEEGAHFFR